MKRIIPILLCLCLCACNSAAEKETERFTLENEAPKAESTNVCSVAFSGNDAEISGGGAALDGKSLLISDGGE